MSEAPSVRELAREEMAGFDWEDVFEVAVKERERRIRAEERLAIASAQLAAAEERFDIVHGMDAPALRSSMGANERLRQTLKQIDDELQRLAQLAKGIM